MTGLDVREIQYPWRTMVLAMICTFAFVCSAYSAEYKTRQTVGRLQEISCSSKDCVVSIKMRNGREAFFIIYDDDRLRRDITGYEKKHHGRMAEIVSYRDRQRGGLEVVRSIRLL